SCVAGIQSGIPEPPTTTTSTTTTSTTTSTTLGDVCVRWNADVASVAEGAWTGSVGTCTAGDIPASGRANYLKLVNLYRNLAHLPGVTNDATLDAKTQQCALMMHANGDLDHSPPP